MASSKEDVFFFKAPLAPEEDVGEACPSTSLHGRRVGVVLSSKLSLANDGVGQVAAGV